MSVRDEARELVPHFKHIEGWSTMMSKWRGLMRTLASLEDRLAGKPVKRRKRRADTSTSEDRG